MTAAVVLLAVALVCALVAIAFLSRPRRSMTPDATPTELATIGSHRPTTPAEQTATSTSDGAWVALLRPVEEVADSRLWMTSWDSGIDLSRSPRLAAGAPLARAVHDLTRTRASSTVRAAANAGSDVFFRLEASPSLLAGVAQGVLEVMPSANGGYRSAIRDVATTRIVGHGSYVSATAAASAGVAVTATPVLAPVLLVAAVTVALDMAAAAEQRERLERIRRITASIQEEQVRRQIAGLEAAAGRLELAARSVLDGGFVPTALGIDGAAATVSEEWSRSSRLLREWSEKLGRLGGSVELDDLEKAFAGIRDVDTGSFWREIALYRASLTLHERATLLAAAHAAAHDPDHAWRAFRAGLEQRFAELDAGREQLRTFARQLADREIRVGRVVSGGRANQAISLTRRIAALASELTHPEAIPDLPAAIGPAGTLELEGVQHADGSMSLLRRPTERTA